MYYLYLKKTYIKITDNLIHFHKNALKMKLQQSLILEILTTFFKFVEFFFPIFTNIFDFLKKELCLKFKRI